MERRRSARRFQLASLDLRTEGSMHRSRMPRIRQPTRRLHTRRDVRVHRKQVLDRPALRTSTLTPCSAVLTRSRQGRTRAQTPLALRPLLALGMASHQRDHVASRSARSHAVRRSTTPHTQHHSTCQPSIRPSARSEEGPQRRILPHAPQSCRLPSTRPSPTSLRRRAPVSSHTSVHHDGVGTIAAYLLRYVRNSVRPHQRQMPTNSASGSSSPPGRRSRCPGRSRPEGLPTSTRAGRRRSQRISNLRPNTACRSQR